MNSFQRHLLRTALDLILAQISCAVLIAYLSLNFGKTGLWRHKVKICHYWTYLACKTIRARHLFEATSTDALRVTRLKVICLNKIREVKGEKMEIAC